MTRRPWVRRTDTERLHQQRSSRREDSCGFQHSSSYTFTLSAPERRAVLVRCRTLPGPKPRTVEAVIRCNHRLTGWSTRASLWPWVPQRAPIRAACSRACRRSPRAGSALRHVLQEQFLVVDIDTELGLYEGDEPDDAERVDHLLAHKRHVVADLRRRPSTGELGADEVPENVGGGHGVTTTSSGLVNDRSSAVDPPCRSTSGEGRAGRRWTPGPWTSGGARRKTGRARRTTWPRPPRPRLRSRRRTPRQTGSRTSSYAADCRRSMADWTSMDPPSAPAIRPASGSRSPP